MRYNTTAVAHLAILCTLTILQALRVGRDSSVDIATRYDLDGPGIESR